MRTRGPRRCLAVRESPPRIPGSAKAVNLRVNIRPCSWRRSGARAASTRIHSLWRTPRVCNCLRQRDNDPVPRLPGELMNAMDNSWVLITGASSGFGEEFARQYAERGHSLVLVARRLERLQKLAGALRQQHRIEVIVEQVDLSDV